MQLTARFEDALVWAVRLHSGQQRKGTEIPYAAHLLGVVSIVLENGGNEDEAIAALLHDAVEDQGGAPVLDEINRRFGAAVAGIVQACTGNQGENAGSWKPRKEQYVAALSDASSSVRLVSAADKLHNARAILNDYRVDGEALWDRFNGDRDEVLWYYRALVDAYQAKGSDRVVDELARVISELERQVLANGSRSAPNDQEG